MHFAGTQKEKIMEDTTNTNNDVQTEQTTDEQQPQEGTQKTFTAEELQAEVDRRVTQAMKKAEKKAEAKAREAEKLAKMNEQQKYEYELTQREQAIKEKEKELAVAENTAAAAGILADKGISTKLVKFVVAEDADTMNDNISLLEQEFKISVKKEVEKRLATATPKKNLPNNEVMDKESFNKLPLTKQAEIYRNNPDLYNSLVS